MARDAGRAMLYGQLGVVDLPLLVRSRLQDGDWSTLWPFASPMPTIRLGVISGPLIPAVSAKPCAHSLPRAAGLPKTN